MDTPRRHPRHGVACRGYQGDEEQQAPAMKLRDELTHLRKAVDDLQVAVKDLLDQRDRVQDRLAERPDNLYARLANMENDLAIIKECLVTRMRSSEQP